MQLCFNCLFALGIVALDRYASNHPPDRPME
jgi:hypothetical protein